MTLNINSPEALSDIRPRLVVIGLGGAGGNAVNNMIKANLEGVEFIAANTDAQALNASQAAVKLQLGQNLTRGLGAGAKPEIGASAARESQDEIMQHISSANMLFIAAGMGGGTGTGSAPEIAKAAKEQGVLTVAVVTKPFQFEGKHRMKIAEEGIQQLQQYADTTIIIPNQNLFRIANERTTFAEAFEMADTVLYSGVRGVTDLMVMPGLINLDFADIRTVMGEMGKAMMGTGEAEGEGRAIKAAEAAIQNPLLDEMSMRGAKGVLINVTGGMDMGLFEVDEAANRIAQEVDDNANIIFGSSLDSNMQGMIRVSVVATGIDAENIQFQAPPAPKVSIINTVSEQTPSLAIKTQESQENHKVEEHPNIEENIADDMSTENNYDDTNLEAHIAVIEEKLEELESDVEHTTPEQVTTEHDIPHLDLNEDETQIETTDIFAESDHDMVTDNFDDQKENISDEIISNDAIPNETSESQYVPLQDSFIPPPPNSHSGIHETISEQAQTSKLNALKNGGDAPVNKEKSGIQQIWSRVLNHTKTKDNQTTAEITNINDNHATPKLSEVQSNEKPAQPSLINDDTSTKNESSNSQLEIPAFLRRQAN